MDIKKLFPLLLMCVCASGMIAFASYADGARMAPAASQEYVERDGEVDPGGRFHELLKHMGSKIGEPGRMERDLDSDVWEVGGHWMLEVLSEDSEYVHVVGGHVFARDGSGRWYVCWDASDDVRRFAIMLEDVSKVSASGASAAVAAAKERQAAAEAAKADPRPSLLDTMMWFLVLAGGICLAVSIGVSVRKQQERDSFSKKLDAPSKQSPVPFQSVRQDQPQPDREGVPKVRIEDVEGVPGLKADVLRLVDCLTHPGRYEALGARTPKGVILYGPPGTGKTLLARAIAGEASVPFISACGSDFIEKYVGVGAKRVRELYEKARKQAPCIVFIDEVDAIASKRGSDENSERDQAVNALLSELDGFDGKSGVITICATNRLDMLDDAFQRAGRFDLKLAVGLPDLKARRRILEIHSRNKPLSEDVDLDMVAKRCTGFSGADLEALMNESAMTAAVRRAKAIGPEDLDEAFFKILMKGNKKPPDKAAEATRTVAWHEAGHALATKLLTDDSVPSVTIVGSSSGAGGVTFRAPEEGTMESRGYLKSLVCVMYAGRAAEELYLGDGDRVTTGASQDIRQATSLIRSYLGTYGMGGWGMLDLSQFKDENALDEASEMAKERYGAVLALLGEHRAELDAVAEALLEKETLTESELDGILEGCAATV